MTVLIFVSTDCPISNRYAPEIKRLHDEFAAAGASASGWSIRTRSMTRPPSASTSRNTAIRTIAERDRDHTLVKKAGATITPEAAVFDARERLVYRGRIDDRFVELGRERPAATRARSQKRDDGGARRQARHPVGNAGGGLFHR